MEIENLLSDIIRIQSVNPPGGETKIAQYLKHLFDEHQIPNEIIEPSPGRGSFLAYLGNGERRLLYLSHTDVVPASEGWNFNPFSGEISNGFVHGRGAIDCKGLVAAEAWAVINLAHSDKLKGRLIFLATADEETGSNLGMKYLVENYKEKIMADFAINEGGKEPVKIGDKTCHFIQVGEKGPAWVRLRTKGVSCHGSLPMLGINAVSKMATIIKALTTYQPKITLIPEVRKLIQTIAKINGSSDEVNESNISQIIGGLEDKLFAGYLEACTRMTISPNAVHGGTKTNIVPDRCEAEIDVRVLPGQDKEFVTKELSPLISDTEMEFAQYSPPTFSPSKSEFYRLLSEAMRESTGDAVVLPCISSGATDSRFLRGLDIPCYGIDMMALNLDPKIRQSVHGIDEKIDVDSLRLKSTLLTNLARGYLGD